MPWLLLFSVHKVQLIQFTLLTPSTMDSQAHKHKCDAAGCEAYITHIPLISAINIQNAFSSHEQANVTTCTVPGLDGPSFRTYSIQT